MDEPSPHYRKPGAAVRRLANPMLVLAMRAGISVLGSRVLEVRGRSTGERRRTPVNLLELDGRRYLVSPRGESQWVRNVRADGGRLTLILGRRRQELVAEEVTGSERLTVLRAYLRRWKMEVGAFFDGVGPDSTDVEMAAIASRHPVFVLSEPAGS